MHLREVSDFDDSVTQFNSSDDGAPTTITQKDPDHGFIEMHHHAPSQATATDFTYRDQQGRMHEVKVIDRPTEDVDESVSGAQRESRQEKALRDLQAPESPIENTEWNSDAGTPGRNRN